MALVKRSEERNRQRPRLCMRERLAVESGRLAAMATGEARGSRVGIALAAGRGILFRVPLAFGEACRILWREDGEQFVQVTVPDGDIL